MSTYLWVMAALLVLDAAGNFVAFGQGGSMPKSKEWCALTAWASVGLAIWTLVLLVGHG